MMIVEDGRALLAPVFPWEKTIPWLEARAAGLQRGRALDARECQIADRRPCARRRRAGMAAAVAERVELLDVADAQPGLLLDPGAQADLEGAMRQRVERAEREVRRAPPTFVARTRIAGSPASTPTIAAVSPISIGVREVSAIAIQDRAGTARWRKPPCRPDRLDRQDHAAVAPEHAVGERNDAPVRRLPSARRSQRARDRSFRRGPGLSAQAVTKAPAVERLMPA
jgi:hypothetical protein